MKHLILASSSPRRRELIKKIASDVSVCSPDCDEVTAGDPIFVATENARRKGRAVQGDFVLACDTVVALGKTLFGKPGSEKEAIEALKALSGKTHEVVGGVYLRYNGVEHVFYDVSKVTFKTLTEQEIQNYVQTFRPLDKAGSYGIQDGVVVASYEGSLDNIVGLPTEKITEVLKEICLA